MSSTFFFEDLLVDENITKLKRNVKVFYDLTWIIDLEWRRNKTVLDLRWYGGDQESSFYTKEGLLMSKIIGNNLNVKLSHFSNGELLIDHWKSPLLNQWDLFQWWSTPLNTSKNRLSLISIHRPLWKIGILHCWYKQQKASK